MRNKFTLVAILFGIFLWLPKELSAEEAPLAVFMNGFKIMDSKVRDIPSSINPSGNAAAILEDDTKDLLNFLDAFHCDDDSCDVPQIALATFEERNAFKAGVSCSNEKGDATPYGLFQHVRLDCEAVATEDGIKGSDSEPSLNLTYAYTGYPVQYKETGVKKSNGDGESSIDVSIDLPETMPKATVGIRGFELVTEGKSDETVKTIGAALVDVKQEGRTLKFRVRTWLENQEYFTGDYSYNVKYTVLGLAEDTEIAIAKKKSTQDDLLPTLLKLFPFSRDVKWLANLLLSDAPFQKAIQLDAAPESSYPALPFIPRGFRFELSSRSKIGGIQVGNAIPAIPGIDIAVNGKKKPLILYHMPRSDWYFSDISFTYFYSYVKSGTPIFQAIPPIGGPKGLYSADVLIPTEAGWKNESGFISNLLKVNVGGSLIDGYVNGF